MAANSFVTEDPQALKTLITEILDEYDGYFRPASLQSVKVHFHITFALAIWLGVLPTLITLVLKVYAARIRSQTLQHGVSVRSQLSLFRRLQAQCGGTLIAVSRPEAAIYSALYLTLTFLQINHDIFLPLCYLSAYGRQ